MLELTTRFTGITTSIAARGGGVSARDASRAAAAHIAYIDRPSAKGERAVSGLPGDDPEEHRAVLRRMARARAKKGGKNGARVLEKGIVSLPNSWPSKGRQEACRRIAAHLAPAGSEAAALVVTHRDKRGNEHIHFAAVDGRESVEAARARRPKAKRVRRAQVIRMTEGGRPKTLRRELATLLNEIADEHGLDGVEWRSFDARGITRKPSIHDGPQKRARHIKEDDAASLEAWLSAGIKDPGEDFLATLPPQLRPGHEALRPAASPSPSQPGSMLTAGATADRQAPPPPEAPDPPFDPWCLRSDQGPPAPCAAPNARIIPKTTKERTQRFRVAVKGLPLIRMPITGKAWFRHFLGRRRQRVRSR